MKSNGFALWLTGLSGSGKTTLAKAISEELNIRGVRVELLDGDEVRQNLSSDLGYTRDDRNTNIRRIGYITELLSRNGIGVVVATISPYRETREELKKYITNYLEIHVDCSIEECIKRDVKGLYQKALKGEIKHFTGITDTYEVPLNPDLVVNTQYEDIKLCVTKILTKLEQCGHI
ncbi:adenylyl-sulfate kinase [Paenibacillus periandrae]|uniref:adenylyl-sulfate kinase n=1 Tax=Paenibacillus periandrae TaxID=1761741 RepID=UPI001F088895|nr:adenylyl-sulfate kinase [Paenibacillus periandrae]